MAKAHGGKVWRMPRPVSAFAVTVNYVLLFTYAGIFLAAVRLINDVHEWWQYILFTLGMAVIIAIGMAIWPKMHDIAYWTDTMANRIKEFFTR